MTAAVPDPREGIDWSAHRGSCRVFYAERRCTCGAAPAPRFRDQLAEFIARHANPFWRAWTDKARAEAIREWQLLLTGEPLQSYLAAEVEARVQAAANQRAELIRAVREDAWHEGYDACRRGEQRHNPYRAAALASPAPAPHAEEGQR